MRWLSQSKAIATFLINFGAHTNILFKVKVNFLALIECSHRPLQLCCPASPPKGHGKRRQLHQSIKTKTKKLILTSVNEPRVQKNDRYIKAKRQAHCGNKGIEFRMKNIF